jgi:hypothetical protein
MKFREREEKLTSSERGSVEKSIEIAIGNECMYCEWEGK